MAKEDKEKPAIITSQGIFCYTKMPFGLRNAGATYQRLVDKAFHKQVGRNLEVYVDDLIIKSRTFLAKSVEKSLPFFKTLKKCTKKSEFHWTTKAEEAFKQMKQLIAELPMLTAPMEKEKLIVYLATTKERVSAILMTEREAKKMPIYFVSRALRGPELNYTSMENLVLSFDYWTKDSGTDGCEKPSSECGFTPNGQSMNGTYVAKEADMVRYLEKVKALTGGFKAFTIKQIPRSENKKADALSKIASTSFAHLSKQVLVKELKEKSISEVEILMVVEEEGDTWMTPIYKYLAEETLPADMKKARAIKRKSWRFAIINGILYKKSFLGPWLRFGLPEEIISDNGKQFRDDPFKDLCEKLCINQHFASVKHPQTNGLVERANRSLGEGIKARLEARSKNWMEELPHVLWAHRTMIKSSNGDTPFSLTYGTEAVIPAEIGMPTIRTVEVDLVQNNEALEINLDLLEERREEAAMREAKSKARMEKYYNAKVRNTSFKPGDLVYRNNDASRAEDTGKLVPKWEGPYEVTEALGKGAYKLRDRDGKQLPRTWNISNLKKCYVHKM
ncbi:reverse transcriptase domain-containing protein [Tanacetum coccineum]